MAGRDGAPGRRPRLEPLTSTKFYLADRKAGQPWATRLHFPVQVLEKVEVVDHVTSWRFANTYAYHHGYFDGPEREFRGFGMVEQWDTESFSAFEGPQVAHYVPPVRTRTWFHTGAWRQGAALEAAFGAEAWAGGAMSGLATCRLPPGLTAVDTREAVRALKGKMLRQEVYADDGTSEAAVPYVVTAHRYEVRQLQARDPNRHGSYLVVPHEQMTWHFERDPSDPRVLHELTLEADDYGEVQRSAQVAYPRRGTGHDAEQSVMLCTETRRGVCHDTGSAAHYHLGLVRKEQTWELTGLPDTSDTAPWSVQALKEAIDDAALRPYGAEPSGTGVERRRVAETRTDYWGVIGTGRSRACEANAPRLPLPRYGGVMRKAALSRCSTSSSGQSRILECRHVPRLLCRDPRRS